MNIAYVILYALLIAGISALIFWKLLLPMKHSTARTVTLIVSVFGTILCEALFILTAMIPSKVDKMLTVGINAVETHYESVQTGYVNKELSTLELEKVLNDTKMLASYIDERPEASLTIQLIGAGAYISYIKTFAHTLEQHIQDMREAGIPITLHNVLERIHELSRPAVLKWTKVLEILVLILSAIFLIALVIIYFIFTKNEDVIGSPRVVVATDEPQPEQ